MERSLLISLIDETMHCILHGDAAIPITGIATHSKNICPGNLFIAKRGGTVNGASFIEEAVHAGAIAIAVEQYDARFPQIVQIVAEDLAQLEAMVAKNYYQHADEKIFLIGITGTSGKTTTSFIIRHFFEQQGVSCGVIGSIGCFIKNRWISSQCATPEILTTHSVLRKMVDAGCRVCVMEVTSIGLDQKRTLGLEFDLALFTNFTSEHLDYHKTMEAYGEAKSQLFRSLSLGKKRFAKMAILNGDDSFHNMLAKICAVDVQTYGFLPHCTIRARDLAFHLGGLSVRVCTREEEQEVRSGLLGRFNAYNLLAAVSVAHAWGFPMSEICHSLTSFPTVPGRLERVENAAGFHIFVDHAHKEDALFQVLSALKACAPARILTVFGCGGDRDQTKRPKMGAIAERLSDEVFVTSDNPRSEDPAEIAAQIIQGMQRPERAHVVLDRKSAIGQAIAMAQSSDIVLIAGKGHEKEQLFFDRVIPFDDVKVVQSVCPIV